MERGSCSSPRGTLPWVMAWWPPAGTSQNIGAQDWASRFLPGQQGRCPSAGIQDSQPALWLEQKFNHSLCHSELILTLWLTYRSSRSCVCPLLVSLMQESCWQITEGNLLRWQGPSARVSCAPGNFPSNSACSVVQWFCEFGWWLTALIMGGSSPALLPAASVLFVISQNICSVSRQKKRRCLCLPSKNNLCNLIQVLKGSCWVLWWCIWSSPERS